ncbi:MAG: beta-lactamase family protein [Ilumatobacteraceae bacterium]|nr:beta-lactamase family protein [Ilumatobacteraceae bacterium]
MDVQGTVASGLEAVRDAFVANFETQNEVGASVAATVDGEPVVDLWGGSATYDHGEGEWEEDTITNVWSTTKTMAALTCLVLADRGELDLYEPIATYWPEFAANGKEQIATRHVLSHTAGLSGWDEPLVPDDYLDHDKLVRLHAAQAPWWEPGSQSGYHAISQGYLLGEVVKRVDGRSLGTFFAEEIAGPLDADFHIGTPAEHDPRIAHIIPPPSGKLDAAESDDPNSVVVRTLTNPTTSAEMALRPEWRRRESPAANGHGNARSVARIHTATANGGSAFGKQILSTDGVERIFDEQIESTDLVLGVPQRLGMGFGLPSETVPLPNPRTCFWGGWGGSLALIDCDAHISFSYTMNRMDDSTLGDERGLNLLMALYGALMAAG